MYFHFRIFSFILYALIFLVGMAGNVLFCYVVISSRCKFKIWVLMGFPFLIFSPFLAMRSVTYWLLVNLSVSDLLITCLCGPVHVIHSIVMGFWPFGAFVCYAYSYFQGMTVLVSSYTLVVISFERYVYHTLPSNNVTRQVTFNRTKIAGKCPN